MTITKTEENGVVTFKPEGWLDTVSSPELAAKLEEVTEAKWLVLDFSMVEYMSSAGLRQVVAANKKAKAMGASFSVSGVNDNVMSIFKMTGLDSKLCILAAGN